MSNKNLALIILVIFGAGCGIEARTYVITKDRVGLDQGSGNGGCIVGKCPPEPAPSETTRKIYVLELTKPVPESEVQKIEETAVNAITDSSQTPSTPDVVPAESAPAAQPAATPQVVVPVVGELPGTAVPEGTQAVTPEAAAPVQESTGNIQPGTTYTVQKDDTLQKISKKFFGTYARWYKIYKANKDKIKNPNVLKAGTVLTIQS